MHAAALDTDALAPLAAFLRDLVAVEVERQLEGRTSEDAGSPWLTLAEAADYLKVSERTIERFVARGRLESTTLGRRRLVHRDKLDALAAQSGAQPHRVL